MDKIFLNASSSLIRKWLGCNYMYMSTIISIKGTFKNIDTFMTFIVIATQTSLKKAEKK